MKKALFAVIATLWITIAVAAEQPVWVTAEGESYQGEMDTPKEVRDRAKRDAERRAVEKAGVLKCGLLPAQNVALGNNA